MTLPPFPARLGPYEIVAPLASGGMGTVLLGRAAGQPPRLLAVKRAHPYLAEQPSLREAFEAEARRLGAVASPHVIRAEGMVPHDRELALAVEYVHGVSLAFLLDAAARSAEALPPAVVVAIVIDALAGLEAIHASRERGVRVLHGDVNPRNVLVGADGRARLCDLGLSCLEGERHQGFRGTPAYASPEAARGEPLGVGADLFPVGIILWESLLTRRLFKGATAAHTLTLAEAAEVPPLPDHRPELAPLSPLLARALAREPAARFPAATVFAHELGAAVSPASGREVGAWVGRLSGDELRRRASPRRG